MTASNKRIAQELSLRKRLAPFNKLFTNPSFQSFKGIVKSIMKNSDNGRFAQFSQDIGKCISSVGYFFSKAAWDALEVKQKLQQTLLKNEDTKPIEGDVLSVDSSSLAKDGDSFQFIGDVHDTTDDSVKSGYELFAAAIVSPSRGRRWLFDFLLCSNKDPKFDSKAKYLIRLLTKVFQAIKNINTVLLDRGLKFKYALKFVLKQEKNFIVRATPDMILEDGTNKRCAFGVLKTMEGSRTVHLEINHKKGWIVTVATGVVRAWKDTIKIPMTVIVVKNPSFKNPLIIVTNLEAKDTDEAFRLYQTYLLRWKIEQIFQTLKEMGLESFRVRSIKAIIRYITMILIVHNLLVWLLAFIGHIKHLQRKIERYLKTTNKIPSLLIGGLKILYEHILKKRISFKGLFALKVSSNV